MTWEPPPALPPRQAVARITQAGRWSWSIYATDGYMAWRTTARGSREHAHRKARRLVRRVDLMIAREQATTEVRP